MSFNTLNASNIFDINTLKNYFNTAFEKWQEILQLSVIAILVLSFIIVLVFAIVNPSKKKKRKEEKIHELHEKLVELKNKILAVDDEINSIDKNIEQAEITAQTKINTLIDRKRQIYESELTKKVKCKDKISELAEKQEIITELKHKQQTGMILSMNKYQKETNSKYADILEKNIVDINRELESYKFKQKTLKDSLSNRRDELESELDKLLLVDKKLCKLKNSSPDAKSEIIKLRNRHETEIKMLEELRIAKEEYNLAYQKRIQAEKNRKIALENVKQDEEDKKKLANLIEQSKKPSNNSTVQEELTPPDTHDVQLIISDPNEDGVPTFSEVPIEIKPQPQENITEPESENKNSASESFEQLSFDDDLDKVVITNADMCAETDNNSKLTHNEVDIPNILNEKVANDLQSLSNITTDEFTPQDPLNLWKIKRPNSEFIAYLTIRGRKIARTNLYTNIVEVKKAIRQTRSAISKGRINFITENGKYYFIVSSKHGKTILTGEKQYSQEACKSDANILKETCKCQIKEIF